MNSIDKLGWVHEVPGTVYTHANIWHPVYVQMVLRVGLLSPNEEARVEESMYVGIVMTMRCGFLTGLPSVM